MLVKKHVSRTSSCTDSLSHSFSKRATTRGIANGSRAHAPILQTVCWHRMFLSSRKCTKTFIGRSCAPDPAGELTTLPRLRNRLGTPPHSLRRFWRLERGPHQAGGPRALRVLRRLCTRQFVLRLTGKQSMTVSSTYSVSNCGLWRRQYLRTGRACRACSGA